MKETNSNRETETSIRTHDPLFSRAGFCSGVLNKLAAVHYAETAEAANAFSGQGSPFETSSASLPARCRDILDMTAETLAFRNYRIENGMQVIDVHAVLRITVDQDTCAVERKETVDLTLAKSEACRTQVVCAPSFFRCRSCGASLSLTEGKHCEYCGSAVDLSQVDWVIRSYKTDFPGR